LNVSAATRHLLINRPAPVSSKTGVCTSSYDRPQFSLVHLHCFPFAIPAEAFRAQRLKSSSDIPHHPIRGNPPEWMGRWIDRLIARSIAQSIVGRSVARSFDLLVARSIVRSLHRLVLFACCFFGFGDVRQEALWQDIYKNIHDMFCQNCVCLLSPVCFAMTRRNIRSLIAFRPSFYGFLFYLLGALTADSVLFGSQGWKRRALRNIVDFRAGVTGRGRGGQIVPPSFSG